MTDYDDNDDDDNDENHDDNDDVNDILINLAGCYSGPLMALALSVEQVSLVLEQEYLSTFEY